MLFMYKKKRKSGENGCYYFVTGSGNREKTLEPSAS
jgi:hypothetical protein